MKGIVIPKGYRSPQSIKETEIAIKDVKDYFERALAKELNLTRGAERRSRGNRAFSRKVEEDGIEKVWLYAWRRAVHGYERNQKG